VRRQRTRGFGGPAPSSPAVLAKEAWAAVQQANSVHIGGTVSQGGKKLEVNLSLTRAGGGRLRLGKLGKAAEPALMPAFRQIVNGMLPKVDFPELLLEVADLTGLADAFTHISGAETSMENFPVSLCAVWLAEACNVGLTPVVKPDVPALRRGRLVQVDQGYFRAENISAGNGLFIDAQAKIGVARAWGGGMVASADGVRFTVPVQTLTAGHNPRYFGLKHKGATWLNVVNDQVMGLGGVVVPGTLRDSLSWAVRVL
jgi:Tn3 transposase DDE domain